MNKPIMKENGLSASCYLPDTTFAPILGRLEELYPPVRARATMFLMGACVCSHVFDAIWSAVA